MKITQITVSYACTQSLPQYSNVKPSLTLTATIDEGEDAAQAEAELWQLVKAHVHAQVDLALEGDGLAAKYDPCPRYKVLRTYRPHAHAMGQLPGEQERPLYVAILPNELDLDKETYGPRWISPASNGDTRKLRYEHACQLAMEVISQEGALLLDCSDGDLSRIPPWPKQEEEEQVGPPDPKEWEDEQLDDEGYAEDDDDD